MSFSLSGLFQNHYISETGTGEASQASGEGLKVTDQRLLALTPGKTISGEVLGNNGSEIQIRLSTDLVVTARMEQPIAAGIGQNVLFEIKSNSGGTLALRPLFENMGVPHDIKHSLVQMGDAYELLGGNGEGHKMIERIKSLPVDDRCMERKDA